MEPNARVYRAVHVTPIRDLHEHVESPMCWCAPDVETFSDGRMVVIHHAQDGRELVEQHGIN